MDDKTNSRDLINETQYYDNQKPNWQIKLEKARANLEKIGFSAEDLERQIEEAKKVKKPLNTFAGESDSAYWEDTIIYFFNAAEEQEIEINELKKQLKEKDALIKKLKKQLKNQ